VSPGGVRARKVGVPTRGRRGGSGSPTHSFSTFSLSLVFTVCSTPIQSPTDHHSNDLGCGLAQAQAINHQRNCLAASHLRHGSRAPGRVRYSIVCP
jgi:hypothetical protein